MKMQLKSPFQTSFGTQIMREFLLLEAYADGYVGYGECVVNNAPYYNEETVQTASHLLKDFLIPIFFDHYEIKHPDEISQMFLPIRRNFMAKSALEGSIWDLYAKQQNLPLATVLGGTKKQIEVGISIGIQESLDPLFHLVEDYLNQGYKRMKIKIKPGKDVEVLHALRQKFGNIAMMADANSAYTLNDLSIFKELDDLQLMMIEQPLAYNDMIDHATLQKQIKTPICLDESVCGYEDAKKAIDLGSTKIINLKIGRVGGLTETRKIHDLCQEKGIPVWCGGMLESGIGRAHNIAIASLSNFTLPGDTAGSSRYWYEDLIQPEVKVDKDGTIAVPTTSGIGYLPNLSMIEKYTVIKEEFIRG